MFVHIGCCHIKYHKWLQRSLSQIDDDDGDGGIDDCGGDDDDDDDDDSHDGTVCWSPQSVT